MAALGLHPCNQCVTIALYEAMKGFLRKAKRKKINAPRVREKEGVKKRKRGREGLREVTCVHVRSRYSNCMATALAQSLSPLSFLSFPLVAYLSFSPSRKFSPRKVSWYVQMRAYS